MGDLDKDRESILANGYLYRFGQFALDSRRRTLSRADSLIPLTPKAFDVLLFLAQNPNRLVTKEELLQAVWADTFVEDRLRNQRYPPSAFRARKLTSPAQPVRKECDQALRISA
jgi:hypothetical protein